MENISKSKDESAENEIPVNEPSGSRDPVEDFKTEETEHLLNQHKKMSSDPPPDNASSMKAADDESMERPSEIDPSQNAPIPEDPISSVELDSNDQSHCDPPSTTIPDEPTENLGTASSGQIRSKRKTYLILGSIVGVLAIALAGFFVYMQLQVSQINKTLELGESYLEEGKYEEAILAFDKALAIDEKVVAAYEGKGASYLGLDDYVQAEEQLETAKTIEFSDNGKILMADVYINTQRKEDGLKLVDEVIASNPEDTKTVIRLGDFYTQLAEYNKVIEILEKRIALTKDRTELKKLYDELIPAYAKSGKTEAEILALLERAAKATGDETYLAKKDTYLVKKPSFSLAPGEYTGAQNLEVVRGNSGDKLYYTIDGTTPTVASPEYTGPIPLAVGEVTVKIIEVNSAGVASQPVEGNFFIKKAGLTESEFIDAISGGWYLPGRNRVMGVTSSFFSFGSTNSGAGFSGPFTIESTDTNGGVLNVDTTAWDPDTYVGSRLIYFDFGNPGDNIVSVKFSDGEWQEMVYAEQLGNGKFKIPNNSYSFSLKY
ncbi:chitobiase/beta-hexosaminidase C-terminal domain-containing protein [Acetobacterium wieringae]|uniref:chitobiase/beta-hexosaminidase C-terminal domain-containing protein n=1 Tax=Acetobacterium wieringae TaxID=52694 RepID=UPI0031592411